MNGHDGLGVSAWISGETSLPLIAAENAWCKICRKTLSTLKQPPSATLIYEPCKKKIPQSTVQRSLETPVPGNRDPAVVRTILGRPTDAWANTW